MTTFPVLPIIPPADLTGQTNGYISDAVLRTIQSPQGKLEKHAATAWNCLQLAAYFDHLVCNQAGAYRPYSTQLKMFNQRYSTTDMGRVPQVRRVWQGKVYYLKPGMSPCSSPGNSTHGLGLAVDVANCTLGSPICQWLLGDGFMTCKALRYGFTWEVADPKNPNFEAWHLQYVTGDTWTQSVHEMIDIFPALIA